MSELEQVYTVGLWTVRPGNEAAFISAWQSFAEWTTKHQPGAMTGTLLQDLEQPQRFISFGPWKDAEGVRAWRNLPEFKAFASKAKELCDNFQPSMMKAVAYS